MRILAFDLGSTMAVAGNENGWPEVVHEEFKGDRITRAAETLKWLRRGTSQSRLWPDMVIYERPFARGQHATRSLWGLAGLIEATFGDICAVTDATPGEIKTWATGNSKASKEEMIARARELGYLGINEHEADAWLLLHYAEAYATSGD